MTRPEKQRSADRILSNVIARHALTNAVVSYVTSSFNTIYRVLADQGEFMLRMSPPQRIHEPHATQAEEAWTDRIREAGLAAPQMIRTLDGSAVVTEERGAERQAVLFTWMDGTGFQWPLTPGQVELLGELSAQLHSAVSPNATRAPSVLDASRDPLYRIRNILRAGQEHLTDRQKTHLEAAFTADDRHVEVELAWHCAQQLRSVYHQPSHADGRRVAEKILASFPTCPVPEIARLGRTLNQWRDAFLGYFTTGGANNGGTEAINGLIELARRVARGFRDPDNYRLRMLLIGGGLRL